MVAHVLLASAQQVEFLQNIHFAPQKRLPKKTSDSFKLRELDPTGKIKKWWEEQIADLAKMFTLQTDPSLSADIKMQQWNARLSGFTEEVKKLFINSDQKREQYAQLVFIALQKATLDKIQTPADIKKFAVKSKKDFNTKRASATPSVFGLDAAILSEPEKPSLKNAASFTDQAKEVAAETKYDERISLFENINFYIFHNRAFVAEEVKTHEDFRPLLSGLEEFADGNPKIYAITPNLYQAWNDYVRNLPNKLPKLFSLYQNGSPRDFSQILTFMRDANNHTEIQKLLKQLKDKIFQFLQTTDPVSGRPQIERMVDALFPNEIGNLQIYNVYVPLLSKALLHGLFELLIREGLRGVPSDQYQASYNYIQTLAKTFIHEQGRFTSPIKSTEQASAESIEQKLHEYLNKKEQLPVQKDKQDTLTRAFDNLQYFVSDVKSLYPDAVNASAAFIRLGVDWQNWYRAFMQSQHVHDIAVAGETSQIYSLALSTAQVGLLDPGRKFRDWYDRYIQGIDSFLFAMDSSTGKYRIEKLADTLYPDPPRDRDLQRSRLEKIRNSYIAIFLQEMTKQVLPAEYFSLEEKQKTAVLSRKEAAQFLQYQHQIQYFDELSKQLQRTSPLKAKLSPYEETLPENRLTNDSLVARKEPDAVSVIDTLPREEARAETGIETGVEIGIKTGIGAGIDIRGLSEQDVIAHVLKRELDSIKSKPEDVDAQDWAVYQMCKFDAQLFKFEENEFCIHKELQKFNPVLANFKSYNHYVTGSKLKNFYENLMKQAIKQIAASLADDKYSQEDLYRVLQEEHEKHLSQVQAVEKANRHVFIENLNKLLQLATNNPTLHRIDTRFASLQRINAQALTQIELFFSAKSVDRHSPKEYDELRTRILEIVNQAVKDILETHPKPATLVKISSAYKKYQSDIVRAVGKAKAAELVSAKKLENNIDPFAHHCEQLKTDLERVFAKTPRMSMT